MLVGLNASVLAAFVAFLTVKRANTARGVRTDGPAKSNRVAPSGPSLWQTSAVPEIDRGAASARGQGRSEIATMPPIPEHKPSKRGVPAALPPIPGHGALQPDPGLWKEKYKTIYFASSSATAGFLPPVDTAIEQRRELSAASRTDVERRLACDGELLSQVAARKPLDTRFSYKDVPAIGGARQGLPHQLEAGGPSGGRPDGSYEADLLRIAAKMKALRAEEHRRGHGAMTRKR